jgi:hypothetical protein
MQNRTHPGDRRTVQIIQARTTRDRIRCNTTQCRTRGFRRRQRRRLKQVPPATPPVPRPRGPVPARADPLKPSLMMSVPLARTRGFQGFNLFRADSPPLAAGLFISS